MADGLMVWDGNGAVMFDQTSQVIKFLGTLSVGNGYTGGAQSGSINDVRFTRYAQHVPFYARIDGGFSQQGYDAVWTFSGNTLSWSYPINGNLPNQTVIYGIM